MLRLLLKKQLTEVFRSYFYDAKKNRMRSKGAIVAWFIFFTVIIVGVAAGVFGSMSASLCGALSAAGMGWLYFLLMGGIAILLGTFGSVFNTYAGLYLSKDNDLLLSLPIPVRTIIAARLLSVYLMGALYSAVAFLPALIVGWITAGASAPRVICGILLFLIITVIVLLLSTLLGWAVAKISRKLKNKSYIAVLAALVFLGGYYFVYFKANALIQDLVTNAGAYGEKIKGAAYVLYLFGRIGEGDWAAAALFTVLTVLIFLLVWYLLRRSFLGIAAAGGSTAKVRYREKAAKEKGAFGALLGKELGRFTASPNYMLNCGLGTLILLAAGVAFLLKGRVVCEAIEEVLSGRAGSTTVLLTAVVTMLVSMNDMAAPSVSLEGKCLWIPQSLPIHPKTALRAKAALQLLLTAVPALFAGVCAAVIAPASLPVRLLIFLTPLAYAAFLAVFNTAVGVRLPVLNWTNELAPIKQSGAVLISLFGSWLVCVIFAGLYLAAGYRLGPALYLLLWIILFAAAALALLRWLDKKGAAIFVAL